LVAASLVTGAVRKNHLLQINAANGLYYDSLSKIVNTNAKGSGETTIGTLYRTQSFSIDKVSPSPMMYYAMIDAATAGTDKLHYAALTPATYAVSYEWDINMPATSTSLWMTVIADNNLPATGYVYVYICTNNNFNVLYSFKKLDGSQYQYMR
jgi:hypothetical protein